MSGTCIKRLHELTYADLLQNFSVFYALRNFITLLTNPTPNHIKTELTSAYTPECSSILMPLFNLQPGLQKCLFLQFSQLKFYRPSFHLFCATSFANLPFLYFITMSMFTLWYNRHSE